MLKTSRFTEALSTATLPVESAHGDQNEAENNPRQPSIEKVIHSKLNPEIQKL